MVFTERHDQQFNFSTEIEFKLYIVDVRLKDYFFYMDFLLVWQEMPQRKTIPSRIKQNSNTRKAELKFLNSGFMS